METLGSLIDKLTIVNIKVWMHEDIKRAPNASDKEIADACRKTNLLNQQRVRLVQEIDELMGQSHFSEADTKIYGRK